MKKPENQIVHSIQFGIRLRAVSLFLQILQGECMLARALSGEAARREKRGPLQSRAWSFACLGQFARRTKKNARSLVWDSLSKQPTFSDATNGFRSK